MTSKIFELTYPQQRCLRDRYRYMMRTAYLAAFALTLATTNLAATETTDEVGWAQLSRIVARIKQPEFPHREFLITDHGAIGDGKTDCKSAFEKAIEACQEAGGGRVVVPKGTWLVQGPIHLKSNVELNTAVDAKILFGCSPSDYLPRVYTRFEGTELMNYSPPIYAFEQENVALTGEGTLDAQGGAKCWWSWKGPWGGEADHGWEEGDPDQREAVAKLIKLADDHVPTEERIFGEGSYLRPSFVQFYRCKNVLVEGVRITNSPMWCIHPVLCENLTVRNVRVFSYGPNNDGCNPESCRNVLIEGCQFDCGDDCIAIKSGRNADGRRIAAPSENIVIRDCNMKDGHGGIVLGSEMSGGIRNVFAENCTMDSPHLERAIRLKSNSLRGGYLENLYVRNIQVGTVSDAVIRVNLLYSSDRGEHPPRVSNIHIENVTSQNSKYPFCMNGLEHYPIENVILENCIFKNAKKPSIVDGVKELTLKQVRIIPE